MRKLRWSKLHRVGDELYYDGDLVAILADGAPGARTDFEDLVTFGEDPPESPIGEAALIEPDPLIVQVEKEVTRLTRGGLVRARDLTKALERLKEGQTA